MKDNRKIHSLEELYRDKFEQQPRKSFSLSGLIAIIFTITALTLTIWFFYNSYLDKPEGEIMIISADNDEIKIKPSDPGGMVVDNMDKAIYETLSNQKTPESAKPEVILPPAEEPVNKNVIILEDKNNPDTDSVLIIEDSETSQNQAPTEQKTIQQQEFITPITKPETSLKAGEPIKQEQKFYKVQIAAFKTQSDAEKEWKHLSKRFPKLIGSYTHYVVTKDIEGKGIFYRLQIGPFDKEKDANKACKLLKESNVNCFVVKPK